MIDPKCSFLLSSIDNNIRDVLNEANEKEGLRNVHEDEINGPPILHEKFHTTLFTSGNLHFDATDWPSKEECVSWKMPGDEEDELDVPVFLPPENKGFQ